MRDQGSRTNFLIEAKKRLRMLHEISAQLTIDQGLSNIFEKVVALTYEQLNAEEAALFVLKESSADVLVKVAVRGSADEIAEQLHVIETWYHSGEGLVGRTFKSKQYLTFNNLTSDVDHYNTYGHILPSRRASHYLGAPIIIGEDTLGVIRVLNKKAPDYSVATGNFNLSQKGFDDEDAELLQIIASQVAAAIRSAQFIDVERTYRNIVACSPDPIIVTDQEGRIRVFNQACERIWGVSAEQALGEFIGKYYESPDQARAIGDLLHATSNYRVEHFRTLIKNHRGEIIPISLSASLLFDKQGNSVGSVGVFRDLREILHRQEEIIRNEKLATIGKLAHTVGHEIKHDMAVALNYIDVLAFENTNDEELAAIYSQVKEALTSAIKRVQNMLMAGEPKPPSKRAISVLELFRSVESSMQRRAQARNISWKIDSPVTDEVMLADIDQMRQALFNLFTNSIDAIETKRARADNLIDGVIEVMTERKGNGLHVKWSDNGCGIPAEQLSNLFVPFVTTKTHGNGLGLFIVKKIVESHGGDISVHSHEGEGTVVDFTIPISDRR